MVVVLQKVMGTVEGTLRHSQGAGGLGSTPWVSDGWDRSQGIGRRQGMSRNLLESGGRGKIRGKNVLRRKCREGLVQRQEKENQKWSAGHACDPSNLGTEAGGSWVWGSLSYMVKLCLKISHRIESHSYCLDCEAEEIFIYREQKNLKYLSIIISK